MLPAKQRNITGYIHTCLLQLSKPGRAKLTLCVVNGSSIKQTSDNRDQEILTLNLRVCQWD